jgi:hypothetical protein
MITSVFGFKLSRLTTKRDAAMAAGATQVALRLTDEILALIAAEKELLSA